jgi:hypothetical protein
MSWAHGLRKLRFVTVKTQEMQYAFFNLALSLICYRFLEQSFCLWFSEPNNPPHRPPTRSRHFREQAA